MTTDIGKLTACPKCSLEAKTGLARFCAHKECPVREAFPHPLIKSKTEETARRAAPIRDEDIFEVAMERFWAARGGNDAGVKAVIEFCRNVFLDKADALNDAAPDMLAALKDAAEFIQPFNRAEELLDRIEAAISKATA
jgi:hypothetical protein